MYHTVIWPIAQFFKVQNGTTNVKEFREEESTLNHVTFLSKNLDHLTTFIMINEDGKWKWCGEVNTAQTPQGNVPPNPTQISINTGSRDDPKYLASLVVEKSGGKYSIFHESESDGYEILFIKKGTDCSIQVEIHKFNSPAEAEVYYRDYTDFSGTDVEEISIPEIGDESIGGHAPSDGANFVIVRSLSLVIGVDDEENAPSICALDDLIFIAETIARGE